MSNLLISFACVCVCVSSYSQQLPYRVQLEGKMNDTRVATLKDIGSSISYIALETNRESLLRDLRRVIVTDSHIVVWDYQRVLLFDKMGQFITEIGRRGRGPDEYLGVYDFSLSFDESSIYLVTYGDYKVLEYSMAGRFLKSHNNITDNVPKKMLPLNDNLFVFNPDNHSEYHSSFQHSLIISDLQGNIRQRYKNQHKLTLERPGLVMFGGSSFYSFNGAIRFREFGSDTLFTVTERGLLPYTVFYLGRNLMPAEITVPANARRRDGSVDVERLLRPYEGKYFLTSVREDVDYLYFVLHDWRKNLLGFYCKRNNNVITIRGKGFQNNIDGGLPFWPKYVYKDILYDFVDPFELRASVFSSNTTEMRKLYGSNWDNLVRLARSLDDESNPVIVVVNK